MAVQQYKTNEARKTDLLARCSKLEAVMCEIEEYPNPVFVDDYTPSKPQNCYLYFKELALPFNCELYS
jgi:hypothetical protein